MFVTQAGGGGGETSVANSTRTPAFSPNGLELAYIGENTSTDRSAIYLADRNGTHSHTLIAGSISYANAGTLKELNGPLAWSPNGKDIAYECGGKLADGTSVYQLCKVDVATGDIQRITSADNERYMVAPSHTERFSWTNDGKDIIGDVFKRSTCSEPGLSDCGNDYIGSINVATGKVAIISDDVSYSPDLSPDGKHIVYYNPGSDGNTKKGIYITSSNGGTGSLVIPYSELIGGAQSIYPDPIYSPDGKDLAFGAYGMGTNPGYITEFRLPIDGEGTPKQLTHHGDNVYDAVWTPVLTTCTVPNLKGLTIKAARKSLEKHACALGKIKGPKTHRTKRHITKQTIKAKKDEPAGTKVGITVK